MKRKLLLASCLMLLNGANAFASAAGKDGKKPEGTPKTASASSAAGEAPANQSAATPAQHDGEIDTATFAAPRRPLMNNFMAASGNAQAGAVAAATATSKLLVRRAAAPRPIAIAQREVTMLVGIQLGNITLMKRATQTINQKLYAAGETTPTHYRSETLKDTAGRLYKYFISTLDSEAGHEQTEQTPTGYKSIPHNDHKHFVPTL